MTADDKFEFCRSVGGAWSNHKAGTNAVAEHRLCGARHGHGGFSRRDYAQRAGRHGVRRGRRQSNETSGVNGGDAGASDGDEIVAKSVE